MLTQAQRKLAMIVLAVSLLVGAVCSEMLRPGHEEYMRAGRVVTPGDVLDDAVSKGWMSNTSFQALLPTVLGIREVIASLMWVRADDYFHRGEYGPIFTMVRQIVAIDPHQLDVYATGAWHIAYNFMDKRLIDNGIQFLEEGCRNNDAVYDLHFELGYMHYDKTKNYPAAIEAYTRASQRATTSGKTVPPSYVRHQLAHAKEKAGWIDDCIEQWLYNRDLGLELQAKGEQDYGAGSINISAAEHNLYIGTRRVNERLAALAERQGNAAEALALWQKNLELADEWLKRFPGHTDVTKDRGVALQAVARLKEGKLRPTSVLQVEIPVKVTRTAPRKFEIEGAINVLDLARVHVRFQDKDYEVRAREFEKVDVMRKMEECTREWESPSVRKGRFKWTLDLDKDPADMGRSPSEIYPLKADEYELIISFNPRIQAAFIQDRYGWNGEGITGKPGELLIDNDRAGRIRGKTYPLRMIQKKIMIKRDDVLGAGKKVIFDDLTANALSRQ